MTGSLHDAAELDDGGMDRMDVVLGGGLRLRRVLCDVGRLSWRPPGQHPLARSGLFPRPVAEFESASGPL